MLNKKFMGWVVLGRTLGLALGFLAEGQTNFVKMLWKFSSVYNCQLQIADHRREVRYAMQLPEAREKKVDPATLYVIQPQPPGRPTHYARTSPQ